MGDLNRKNQSLLICVLTFSCLTNVVLDILLLWGVRETGWDPGIDALIYTPEQFNNWGALGGLFTITCWFALVPSLNRLEGWAGQVAMFGYCAYVASLILFHGSYAFIGIALRRTPDLLDVFLPLVELVVSFSAFSMLVVSLALAYLGFTKSLVFRWYHYLGLPFVSVLIFSVVFGYFLSNVPYYLAISGTVAMLAFFLSFLHQLRLTKDQVSHENK